VLHDLPPLPPWARRFRSDALEEVMAYTGVVDIPRARVVKQPKSLGFNFFSVLGTDASVACAKVAAAQTVRGQVMPPVVHLAQPTGSVYRVGRRVLAQTSDTTAIMVAPE
jgi:hypothetical protein